MKLFPDEKTLSRIASVGIMVVLGAGLLFAAFPQLIPKVEACGANTSCTNVFSNFGIDGCRGCTVMTLNTSLTSMYVGDTIIVAPAVHSKTTTATTVTALWFTFTSGSLNLTQITGVNTASATSNLDSELWFGVIPHSATCSACTATGHIRFSTAVQGASTLTGRWRSSINATLSLFGTPLTAGATDTVSSYTFNGGTLNLPANSFVYEVATCGASTTATTGTLATCSGNSPISPATAVQSFVSDQDQNLNHADSTYYTGTAKNNFQAGVKITTWCAGGCTPSVVGQLSFIAVVFSVAAASVTSNTQTAGICPPGGGTGVGHYSLTNSTIFFYPANALGAEVVNTVQTEVASITGSGSHTLQLLIYASSGQNPSITSPAFRVFTNSYTITSGTTNSTITTQVSIPLNNPVTNALPFNYWFVGIVGDDHINIAGSTLSGLMTQTGNPPASNQPSAFTSAGLSSTKKLALCATGSFQTLLSFTTTAQTTLTGTSFTTATTTSTISTIGSNFLSTETNWPIVFLILMLPAGLLLGATRTIVGALLGLMIGAVIGVMGGILPPWIFVGLVIALVSVAFLSRSRE